MRGGSYWSPLTWEGVARSHWCWGFRWLSQHTSVWLFDGAAADAQINSQISSKTCGSLQQYWELYGYFALSLPQKSYHPTLPKKILPYQPTLPSRWQSLPKNPTILPYRKKILRMSSGMFGTLWRWREHLLIVFFFLVARRELKVRDHWHWIWVFCGLLVLRHGRPRPGHIPMKEREVQWMRMLFFCVS